MLNFELQDLILSSYFSYTGNNLPSKLFKRIFILVVGQFESLESHKYEKIMVTTSNPIHLKFSWPFHIWNTLPNLKTYFMMYTLYFFIRICCHHCKNAVFSPKGCNWNIKYSTWSHTMQFIDLLTFSGINKQLDYLFKTFLF